MSATATAPCSELGGLFNLHPAPLQGRPGGTLYLVWLSDLHFGQASRNKALLREELEEARALGARVSINGDVFDAILAKDPKRFKPSVLDHQLHGLDDIIGGSVDMALEELGPYADLIDMVGCGNHEAAVEAHHSLDMTRLLVGRLNKEVLVPQGTGHRVLYGGYTGYLVYKIAFPGVRQKGRFVTFYHHDSGGGSSLSASMGAFGRFEAGFHGADAYWLAHRHTRGNFDVVQIEPNLEDLDDPVVKRVRLVRTGAYGNTYRGQSQAGVRRHGRRGNYAADAGMREHGQGGALVKLRLGDTPDAVRVRVEQ